jgi:hypothetical protein
MHFVATLTHTPDNCWAHEENVEKATDWIQNMSVYAEEAGVTLHSAHAAPNEHTFYFVVEADEFEAVTDFFGPPVLEDHDADIVPVTSFEAARDTVLKE